LSEAVIRELENVAQGRINREDFARAVETLQKGWEQNMQSNRYLARNYASLRVTLNLPPGNLHSLPARYAAVRPQDIQNLCRSLLPLGPARIVLYPGRSEEG
jgi:predicted Zn-dependent peptidase